MQVGLSQSGGFSSGSAGILSRNGCLALFLLLMLIAELSAAIAHPGFGGIDGEAFGYDALDRLTGVEHALWETHSQ